MRHRSHWLAPSTSLRGVDSALTGVSVRVYGCSHTPALMSCSVHWIPIVPFAKVIKSYQ